MTKYPKTLVALLESDDISVIYKGLDKKIKKDTSDYELRRCAKYLLNEKSLERFIEICLDYPNNTPTSLKLFSDVAIDYFLKKQDEKGMSVLLERGIKPSHEHAVYRLCEYLKKPDKSAQLLEMFKTVDWSKANKQTYCVVYNKENLDTFFNIVGESNFTKEDINHMFEHNITYCDKEMLNKYFSLGASIYEGDVLNKNFLNNRVYFPQVGTYGFVTLQGRQNVVSLLKPEDKSLNNPEWANFIEKTFEIDESYTIQHMTELIKNNEVTPLYQLDKNKFWRLLSYLSKEEIVEKLHFYKQEGFEYNDTQSALITKVFLEYASEKVDVLIEFGLKFDKFLKSDFAQSIKSENGFIKKRKLPNLVVQDMKDGLIKINSTIVNDKLQDELPIKDEVIKKRKI